jgi:threonine 3-dehydrogenase
MRALVKSRREPGLWMEDVAMPHMGINDVLIRVLRTGICGTDVHIWNWDAWAQKTIPVPMVVGHEFVGEIVDVGANVNDWKPGQIVSGEGHVVCGRCRNCMAGRRHLCAHTSGVGVNRPGAFAEYIVLPYGNVWEHERVQGRGFRVQGRVESALPEPLTLTPEPSLEVASIFDPLGNAVHTALQWDLLGEDVLITGAGPIGAMACAVAKFAGARFVVITDVNEYRLALAKKLGADRVVNVSREKLPDVQRELGMKEGFDVGLEMSGTPSAFRDLIANMAHGGKVSVLGIPEKELAIDWNAVVFNMLTIKGIYGREMYETWYKMSVMIQGGLDISPVITHRFDANDFVKGFDVMRSGQSGKVVLKWND